MIEPKVVEALRCRHAKQQEVPHARLEVARDAIECGIVAETDVLAESGNRLLTVQSLDDEERLDELGH